MIDIKYVISLHDNFNTQRNFKKEKEVVGGRGKRGREGGVEGE